ncbi:MAG: hypothetical protein ABJG88_02660, partial [Litorimonas sp.]
MHSAIKMWSDFVTYAGGALTATGWVFLPLCTLPLIYIFLHKSRNLQDISNAIITLIDGVSYALGEAVK